MFAFEANPVMVTDNALFWWMDMRIDVTLGQKLSTMAPTAPDAQQLQPDPNLLVYLTSALGKRIENVMHAQQVHPHQSKPKIEMGSMGGRRDNYDLHAIADIKG